MKWLGLLAVLALAGCQEVGQEVGAGSVHDALITNQDATTAISKEKKTFSHPPAELKTVLEKLRKETGWKMQCRPELAKELVYLKFKDKDEVEVARVLQQILACDGDVLEGALTLFVHKESQIARSIFQEDVYKPRIQDELDALQKAVTSRGFHSGPASEIIDQEIELLNGIRDFNTPENERILQTISPGQKTILTMVRAVPLDVLMNLKTKEPVIWSTSPQPGELKMTEQMEDRLDAFITASMEWNGALEAAKSAGKLHKKMPWPIFFNPRGDFALRIERGGNQIMAGGYELTCRLAAVKGPLINELAGVGIPLDRVKMAASGKSYPDFDREIERLRTEKPGLTEWGPGRETRVDGQTALLLKAIEQSTKGSDNVAANLQSDILEDMGRLIWPRAIRMKPSGTNPEAILLDAHNKGSFEGFQTYRPHFVSWVRIDRDLYQ